jgi:hypothetical protein
MSANVGAGLFENFTIVKKLGQIGLYRTENEFHFKREINLKVEYLQSRKLT